MAGVSDHIKQLSERVSPGYPYLSDNPTDAERLWAIEQAYDGANAACSDYEYAISELVTKYGVSAERVKLLLLDALKRPIGSL